VNAAAALHFFPSAARELSLAVFALVAQAASSFLSAGDPDDEALLVAQLKSRDDEAFARVVRRLGGPLLATARRFLRCEEDARDAVQEAFISAHQSIDSFAGHSRLSTWLHRIVVNCCLMKLRSRRRHPEESIESLLPTFDGDGQHADVPDAPWVDIVGEVERKERCALVRELIGRLPDSYRTVLLMRDIEELDTAETARLLGVTENAVKIRLHRARQALRTLLDPHMKQGLA
jgi:RNA polymerase sigma-70 factor (ECF subfamily)